MADIPELSMQRAGRYTQAAFATELQKYWGMPMQNIELPILMRMLRSCRPALSTRGPSIHIEDDFVARPGKQRFL